MADITEAQRECLHTKVLEYVARKGIDDRRGVRGPGIALSDSDLSVILRLTRAKAPASNEQKRQEG